MRGFQVFPAFLLFSAAASLVGCETTKDPTLLAAAMPKASTPPTVSGTELQACVADSNVRNSRKIGAEGGYEPGATYKFATYLKSYMTNHKDVAPYPDRVRGYSVDYEAAPLIGFKSMEKFLCYYELKDGSLRYLVTLTPSPSGEIDRNYLASAVTAAYVKMGGKKPGFFDLF